MRVETSRCAAFLLNVFKVLITKQKKIDLRHVQSGFIITEKQMALDDMNH